MSGLTPETFTWIPVTSFRSDRHVKPRTPQEGFTFLFTLFLAFLAVGLSINPDTAHAEEPAPAVTAPAPITPNPASYFVVVGSSEFPKAPGLTGAEGATADCLALAEHLRKQGFENQVMSACGPELVRTRFFVLLQEYARKVPAGGTLFVVWVGHGGIDPQSGTKLMLATDGSFDLFVTDEVSHAASGYYHDAITPSLLYAVTRQNIPTNARVVFVTDVARGGVYKANGGEIVLEGPSAEDFRDMPGVLALSPTPGKSVRAGLTRETLVACLVRPQSGGAIEARQLLSCYAEKMTEGGVTIDMAGEWKEGDSLVFFPSLPEMPAAKKRKPTLKIALITGGGTIAVASGVGAYMTYRDGVALIEDVNSGVYGVEGDPRLDGAYEAYNQTSQRFTAWCVAGGIGLATSVVGVALPMPSNTTVTVTAGPNGLRVAGTF